MDFVTDDLGRGGARQRVAELCFTGRLGEPFLDFAVSRAEKLGLRGWAEATALDSVTVFAEGPEALVHALEITCSLGPIESTVESWTYSERAAGVQFDISNNQGRRRFGTI